MPSASRVYRQLDLQASGGGPLADEILLDHANSGPVAGLWQAEQGLVVPRTYAARPGFTAAQASFAKRGWPIHVRQSGGGVVPQGPGILNLSLARVFSGRPLDHSEAFYEHLCGLIAGALLFFGIEARAQAVEGSFCDGRFNLAVGHPARKVAGTAQWWRRTALGSAPRLTAPRTSGRTDNPAWSHIGVVHALILTACDTEEATSQANALEAELGNARRYDPAKVVSLDQLVQPDARPDFATRFQERLGAVLTGNPF